MWVDFLGFLCLCLSSDLITEIGFVLLNCWLVPTTDCSKIFIFRPHVGRHFTVSSSIALIGSEKLCWGMSFVLLAGWFQQWFVQTFSYLEPRRSSPHQMQCCFLFTSKVPRNGGKIVLQCLFVTYMQLLTCLVCIIIQNINTAVHVKW
jgi:hypothetical protein